jgi:head-tail adaptor
MPPLAGPLRERITLQRLDLASEQYLPIAESPTMAAAVEPMSDGSGEERYLIRIRARPDLRGKQDLYPAMRVIWRDRTLDLEDVVETARNREVHLIASVRLIEVTDLPSGARRTQKWP